MTEYYKNDFEEIVNDISNDYISSNRPTSSSGTGDSVNSGYQYRIGGPKRKGEIDYDLLVLLTVCIMHGSGYSNNSNSNEKVMFQRAEGSVLIFMPGVPEISKLIRLLEEVTSGTRCLQNLGIRVRTMALHGNLSPSDQKAVFVPARSKELKIVVATNVAEASVTIPDVTVVIDSCRVKEIDFDIETRMTTLKLKFASQDSLRQRRGRAGRV